QAVIESRLAHLSPPAHMLATWAAAMGRPFTLEFMCKASGKSEEILIAALEELGQRRVVTTQGYHRYDFSHDLIREVTYTSLSPARKSFLHRRLAETMTQMHAGEQEVVDGQIAEHFERAGLPLQALP